MSYYSDTRDEPEPGPTPEPSPSQFKPSMALVALVIALAGLFMPIGSDGWKSPIPIPIPPFVDPVNDAAKTEGSWVIVV